MPTGDMEKPEGETETPKGEMEKPEMDPPKPQMPDPTPPPPVDKPPTAFTLSANGLRLPEGTIAARKLADIQITDDGLGTNTLALSGSSKFEIRGTELWLKAGALDYETAQSHTATITLSATGTGSTPAPVSFTLSVSNVDEPPTAMRLSSTAASIAEGVTTAKKLADITFTDDALGNNAVTMATHRLFEIRSGTELWLKADVDLDYETAADRSHSVTLTATSNNALTQTFTLTVTNVDEAPTAFTLSANALELEEATSTARDLATIDVTDADGGPSGLTLSQTGDFFVLDGTTLKLADGKTLTVGTHTATLSISGLPDQMFTLTVKNVLRGTENENDVLIGGAGIDRAELSYLGFFHGIFIDLSDATRWKQSDDGRWQKGSGEGFIFQRIWIDWNGDGRGGLTHDNGFEIRDSRDEYDYFTGIEQFHITESISNDTIIGGSGDDRITSHGRQDKLFGGPGNDELIAWLGTNLMDGGPGDDRLIGYSGDDTYIGGAGDDIFIGGSGNDSFVLGDETEGRDVVTDFSFGTSSGDSDSDGKREGDDDEIRVTTKNGDETTIEALKAAAQIRWTQNRDSDSDQESNDKAKPDTIIYRIIGVADDAADRPDDDADDIAVMILEDFTAPLTIDMFDVVAEVA